MFVAGRWLYFGKWPAPSKSLIFVVEPISDWFETDTDRWESKGKFVPSNKALIAKTFSVVLDRKAFPVPEWQKITMPVLMIHGGDSMPDLNDLGHSHS
jgi:hypothetical protein